MAISSAKPTRSISLPSRLHPNSEKFEAKLNNLKTSWDIPFSSRETPLRIEAIRSGLTELVQLYNSTKELIESPLTQQALLKPSLRKTVEETLDGSIAIIDTCEAARDMLLRTKESVFSLQSSLRRKSSIESDVNAYISFRKSVKRDIGKRLRALKTIQISNVCEDRSLEAIISVMREVNNVAISIFRCIFVFLSTPVTKGKASGWGLISKLMPIIGSNSEKEHKMFNEIGSLDISVVSLQGQLRKSSNDKRCVDLEVEMLGKRLKSLESCVDGVELGLECLFRCLIQHRVSLLNLITSN